MKYQKAASFILWSSLVVTTIFVVACGQIPGSNQAGQTTDPAAKSFGSVYAVITNTARCKDCHTPPDGSGVTAGAKIDFSTKEKAYTSLTTLSLSGGTSGTACTLVAIVDSTGVVTKSGLAAVLFSEYNSTTTVSFGGRSACKPYTGHHSDLALSATDKTNIIGWIEAKAPNN